MSVLPISILLSPCFRSDARPTYVDLRIFKSLLQVVIDSFIRDLADEGEIRNSNFLLFSALKNGLPDLGLSPSTTCRLSIAIVLLAASALCDCLLKITISIPSCKSVFLKVSHTIVGLWDFVNQPLRMVFRGIGLGGMELIQLGQACWNQKEPNLLDHYYFFHFIM